MPKQGFLIAHHNGRTNKGKTEREEERAVWKRGNEREQKRVLKEKEKTMADNGQTEETVV